MIFIPAIAYSQAWIVFIVCKHFVLLSFVSLIVFLCRYSGINTNEDVSSMRESQR